MKIDNTLLFKFFSKENTASEADAIAAWLKESDAHVLEFQKAYKLFALSQIALSGAGTGRKSRRRIYRWGLAAVPLAAALVIGLVIGNNFRKDVRMDEPMMVSEAKWGNMISQRLSDGTTIEMNAGTRLEYPALFREKERRVKLEGEAVFDVAHNEAQPFIVETFAYDVRVLGTKFDVVARPADNEFSATLLEGSIEVLDKNKAVRARLSPNQVVRMDGSGNLYRADFDDALDDMIWQDGLVSVAGASFSEIMKRLEKGFGVSIQLDMKRIPENVLPYGKVRIADGIVAALGILQHHYDFDYEYDAQKNLYIIK